MVYTKEPVLPSGGRCFHFYFMARYISRGRLTWHDGRYRPSPSKKKALTVSTTQKGAFDLFWHEY